MSRAREVSKIVEVLNDSIENIDFSSSITTASSAAVAYLVDGAPEDLDTLNEISSAINNDPDFYNTLDSTYLTQSSASVNYATKESGLPNQSENIGKYLITDGESATWSKLNIPVAIFQDKRATSEDGQTYTSTSWNVQRLNSVPLNTINSSSLSNDTVTLPEGTYYVQSKVIMYSANSRVAHSRIITTNNTVLVPGLPTTYGTTGGGWGAILLEGGFTISSTTSLNLQVWINATNAATGGSIASGEEKVYATLSFFKL